jgi:glycosyltransferase involved in cell wall biosynthesis
MSTWLPGEFEARLVSVIIPTYNRAAMLSEALASVLHQTHDRVEAIVVDDGSSDNTIETVADWQRRFRAERGWELTLLRQSRQGGNQARNLATQSSHGEFLNYLDDDDLLTADKVASQVAVAQETGADIVFGAWVPFIKGAEGCALAAPQCAKPPRPGRDPLEAWLHGRSWKIMAAIIRRSFADRAGPWATDLRLAQDLEFAARCLCHAPKMAYCPQGALLRRDHPHSLSHRSLADFEDSLIRFAQIVEEYALKSLPAEVARPALAQYLGRHAVSYRLKGSVAAAEYLAKRTLELDPRFAPTDKGFSTRLAYRLGGFRLWALRNRTQRRLKRLRRALLRRQGPYRPVNELPLAAWPPQPGGAHG